jgi:hypothetical protein
MPKPLTNHQLTQALGTKPPLPVARRGPEYDPKLDADLESFLKNEGRPAYYSSENPWPAPDNLATDLYLRLHGTVLLGPGERNIAELPQFLSCLKRTQSELVRDTALRAVFYIVDEFESRLNPELVSGCISALEAHPELLPEGYSSSILNRVKEQYASSNHSTTAAQRSVG